MRLEELIEAVIPKSHLEMIAAVKSGNRFFVLAQSGTQIYAKNPKQRLICSCKSYGSARKTFEGWRTEHPTLLYWDGETAEDSLVIIDGSDYGLRLNYLVAQLNLMSRGLIPSNQQQREELAEQIKRQTPCEECGMTGLHTLMCSKRPPTPEEQLRARVAALEGNLRAIATCFEDLHAKSNAEEYTDTGEVWEMICTLHRGIRNTLGPTPANVAAVDKELT